MTFFCGFPYYVTNRLHKGSSSKISIYRIKDNICIDENIVPVDEGVDAPPAEGGGWLH